MPLEDVDEVKNTPDDDVLPVGIETGRRCLQLAGDPVLQLKLTKHLNIPPLVKYVARRA